jgi:hypothetical protein
VNKGGENVIYFDWLYVCKKKNGRGVPASRVHAVEAATGIPGSVLGPDLYLPERER